MTCQQCRQEIELLFGESTPTQAVQAHCDQCDECATVWKEQHLLSSELRQDVLIDLGQAELDALVGSVNERIDAAATGSAVNIVSLPGMRKLRAAVSAAAAVVLLLGAGLVVQQMQYSIEPVSLIESNQQTDILTDNGNAAEASLGDTTVSALLYEYARAKPYSASEDLLTEISDDEWQYLESEFDLGGLL